MGQVGMAIVLPSEAGTVSSVEWAITGNGVNRTATINVGNSRTASAQIGGLPAGIGYLLSMNGKSTDGKATCLGSATFDIVAGQVTKLSLNMTCSITGGTTNGTNTQGSVSVTAGTTVQVVPGDICPVINSIEATPAEVLVGNTIALSAAGTDADSQPSALSYNFATAGGTGSATLTQSGASAQLTCVTAGTVVISVTISDGLAACNVTNSETVVVCSELDVPATGGAPGAGGSSAVDTTVAGVGGSTAADTSAVGGAPPVDTTVAGTGGTTAADTSAVGGAPAAGGTTAVDTTPAPRTIYSVALATRGLDCYSCALTNCTDPETSSAGMDLMTANAGSNSCEAFAPTDVALAGAGAGTPKRELCLDNLQCILESRCTALNTVTPCFCGTASSSACLSPGNANGVCKATEEAGLESTDPTYIASNFGNILRGAGSSNQLVQCMIDMGCNSCL